MVEGARYHRANTFLGVVGGAYPEASSERAVEHRAPGSSSRALIAEASATKRTAYEVLIAKQSFGPRLTMLFLWPTIEAWGGGMPTPRGGARRNPVGAHVGQVRRRVELRLTNRQEARCCGEPRGDCAHVVRVLMSARSPPGQSHARARGAGAMRCGGARRPIFGARVCVPRETERADPARRPWGKGRHRGAHMLAVLTMVSPCDSQNNVFG